VEAMLFMLEDWETALARPSVEMHYYSSKRRLLPHSSII